jgi:hypothetical protein
LEPAGVIVPEGDPTVAYRERQRQRGVKEGVMKVLPLDIEGGWSSVFKESHSDRSPDA